MPDPVDGKTFRAAMRRVPAPVVVVTAKGVDEARGITIGSFTSVALNPPLICFNVGHEASMYEVMEVADRFVVHVLGEGQAYLADHFAIPDLPGAEQFESVPHRRDAFGIPILEGVSAVLHCTPYDSLVAGDHTIYVGLVVDVEERPDDGAVLYYRRAYRGVGNELRSSLLSPVKRASSDSS